MNELTYGSDLAPPMVALLRDKMDVHTLRKTVLQGHRWTGPEALKVGIVDGLAKGSGLPDVLKFIKDQKLVGIGEKGVYGLLRDEMYRETMAFSESHGKGGIEHRDDLEKEGRPRWSKL